MKKVLSMTLVLLMLLGVCTVSAFATDAAPDPVTVYVTIADANGKLVLSQEPITVSDADHDNVISIHDAFYAAHEAKYTGGAAAGYETAVTQYGISLTKLWGIENGGSYGYYINHASAWSMTDPVKQGDYVSAFAYTDLTAWSDQYCYFDCNTADAKANESITLTLSTSVWDNTAEKMVEVAVANAVITLNGTATSYKTDADGKVTLTVAEAGTYLVSATSETQTLVPPVCMLTVAASEGTDTTDGTDRAEDDADTEPTTVIIDDSDSGKGCGSLVSTAGITAVLLTGVAALLVRKRKS